MQLSETTIAILKNCSQLNQNILIEAGSTIRTVNTFKTTMFKCTVPEVFNHEVRLHNLSDFIRILSLFDNPEFDFGAESVTIYDASGASMKYGYSDREDLVVETRDPPDLEVVAEFPVTNDQLNKITRSAQMNKVEDIGFLCEDGAVKIKAHNKERTTREFTVDVNGTSPENFSMYLKHGRKCAKLTLLPLDYVVQIGTLNGREAIRFVFNTEEFNISYIVAAEYGSYIGFEDGIPF